MPWMLSEIPETFEAIARPVAMDITRELGALMRLPSVTEILFTGSSEQAPQSGSTLNYEGAPSKFPGGSRIEVTMNESNQDVNVFADNAAQENAPTILLDSALGIRLRPVYATTVVTLSFNIRAQGRTAAEKIRDEFRTRVGMGRQQLLHTVTYSFGIPDEQLEVLKQLWSMREAVAGYGEDFDTWLRKVASPRLTTLTTQTGGNALYSFGEIQTQVQGMFDFQVAPEAPDKSDPDGMYTYPIEYKFTYSKPVGTTLDYPLMVHNQVIPPKYHGIKNATGSTPQPYAGVNYSDLTTAAFRKLFLDKELAPSPIDGVRFPLFDDWMPGQVAPNTSTVYVCMLMVNPADPQEIIDLTDLPSIAFDGDVRQYLLSQGSRLGVLYQSAFHVEIYSGASWMEDTALTVGSDLKVRATAPLDQRKRYHLRISLVNDLFRLTDAARLDLRVHGAACQKILLALQAKLPLGTYVPRLVGPGIVPDQYLLECATRINRYKGAYATGLECRMLTVGNVIVSINRLSAYASDHPADGPTGPVDPASDPNYESVVPDCNS